MSFLVLILLAPGVIAQETPEPSVVAGRNVNMVSGTEWPEGDPFLQRQNEPTIGVSTRNDQHLMGGSNDYRTVDLPGLPDGKETGDSWISAYFSYDGGARWKSTLLPGYPQDDSPQGLASPLKVAGYEASADPVIRPGTHGLFYYSGIAFTRSDNPPSAGFVATYVDLNNDERGNTIHYVDTTVFDSNADGTSFIDKPWIAVDKPRAGAASITLNVETDNGVVPQPVECGNVYAAYARIQGEGDIATQSQIMFTKSEDCARTFSAPLQLSLPDTINQGAAVAIDPSTGRIQIAWRQFENATMSCTRRARFWKRNPDAWPISEAELAGVPILKEEARELFTFGYFFNESEDRGDDLDDDDDDEHDDDGDGDDDRDGLDDYDGGDSERIFRQYVAAWLNVLAGADPAAIETVLDEAEAFFLEFPPGSELDDAAEDQGDRLRRELRRYNRGRTGPGSCAGLAATTMSGVNPDAIMVVSSSDFGATFSSPVAASSPNYSPFEQGTTEYSFRSTGYPTMVFDGDGRSYIAYTTRGVAQPNFDAVGGDGRIVVTTSNDGSNWTTPLPIDEPQSPGHQLMPALEFARGKVFLLYYDFRADVSGIFDRFVVDLFVDPTTPRHSVDVRVAQAPAANVPVFTDYSVLDGASTQASRYPFLVLEQGGQPVSTQTQFNPPNLPMFQGGLVPFFGDFIDIATLHFVRDPAGTWEFNSNPALGAPVAHAVWTDNRDVVAPLDGDWTSYVPPGDGTPRQSIFDPTREVPVCSPLQNPDVVDRTKMRNQNIYTTKITEGIAVAVPGNNRPLGFTPGGDLLQRAFVVFVQNLSERDREFRLEIPLQPVGGSASFNQFSSEILRSDVVERYSSLSRSVYVTSTDPQASVQVLVTEIDDFGNPVAGGLSGTARINPDPTAPVPSDGNILVEEVYTPAIFNPAIFNPAIFNPALLGSGDVGIYNPAIFNPAIFNDPEQAEFVEAALVQMALLNPAIFNPAIFNPAIFNPAIFNPAIFNPAIFNPAIFNPAIFNPAIFNPSTANPAIFNPAIFNPAIFNSSMVETSIVVENQGNTTAAYSLNLDLENPPEGFLYQVMIYKTYLLPTANGCDLEQIAEQEQLVNELTPDVNGSLLNPDSTSFFVNPGDNVVVSVRIVSDPNAPTPGDPSTIDTLPELDLSQAVVPQAVDTEGVENGETQPVPAVVLAPSLPPLVIGTGSLPDGQVGFAYSATLAVSGGGGTPVSWSLSPGSVLPPGLALTTGGQIHGTPSSPGTYNFTVRAQDDDQLAERALAIDIAGAPVTNLAFTNFTLNASSINIGPTTPISYTATIFNPASVNATAVGLRTWVRQSGASKLAGNFLVACGGPSQGDVPPGGCSQNGSVTAANEPQFVDGDVTDNHWTDASGNRVITIRETLTEGVTQNRYEYEVFNETSQNDISLFRVLNAANLPKTMASPAGWIPRSGVPNILWETANPSVFIGPGESLAGFEVETTGALPNRTTNNSGWVLTLDPLGQRVDLFGTVNRRQDLRAGPATVVVELLLGGAVVDSIETPVTLTSTPGLNWQADIDFTAETPSGPYVCLRHQFTFSEFIPVGQGFTMNIFDEVGGPVIGSWNFTNNFQFPINNVGQEIFLSGTALTDGLGFEVINFDLPNVPGLDVQGRTGQCIGGGSTNFVETIISELP